MSRSPIHFTKKAVKKLIELQDEVDLSPRATFSITVEDLNLSNELIYAFSYKVKANKDEMCYESNGFPYILNTETAMCMINSKIDYKKGSFTVDLDINSAPGVLAEA
jgi:Fe-S cluster assembly iron-binding protein IscA